MFKIISDGGCDFSKEEARENNVEIVPFYVTFDQTTHLKEGIDISKEEYPQRTIIAIDSLNVCVGQGLILREIIKMRDAGHSLQEAAAIAKKILETTRVYFTLDSLEYLKRGGRVGPTTALVFQANTEAALEVIIANPITEIGAAIGAHAGPGALAFAYCKKFDTMQMREGVVA